LTFDESRIPTDRYLENTQLNPYESLNKPNGLRKSAETKTNTNTNAQNVKLITNDHNDSGFNKKKLNNNVIPST